MPWEHSVNQCQAAVPLMSLSHQAQRCSRQLCPKIVLLPDSSVKMSCSLSAQLLKHARPRGCLHMQRQWTQNCLLQLACKQFYHEWIWFSISSVMQRSISADNAKGHKLPETSKHNCGIPVWVVLVDIATSAEIFVYQLQPVRFNHLF